MQIDLRGDVDILRGLVAVLVHDGFMDTCQQLKSNGLYGGDFHGRWYEIVPLVFAATDIACRRFLLDRDEANLDEAIKSCIYNTGDLEGYHHVFGNREFQSGLVEIMDLDKFSAYVDELYQNYLGIAGRCSDLELANCEVELGRRMSVVEGDKAKTGLVMRSILQGTKRVLAQS